MPNGERVALRPAHQGVPAAQLHRAAGPAFPPLTPRQAEIAVLVARGLSGKAIAERLGLSVTTVEAHVSRAAARLPGKAWPRARLLLWAAQHRRKELEA